MGVGWVLGGVSAGGSSGLPLGWGGGLDCDSVHATYSIFVIGCRPPSFDPDLIFDFDHPGPYLTRIAAELPQVAPHAIPCTRCSLDTHYR